MEAMMAAILSEGGPLAVAIGMAVWLSGKWTNHKIEVENEKDNMAHEHITGQLEVLHQRHDKLEAKMDASTNKLDSKLERLLSRD